MDSKWVAIMILGWCVAMFGGIGFSEYTKTQCRTEAIKAGMSPDDIVKLCK